MNADKYRGGFIFDQHQFGAGHLLRFCHVQFAIPHLFIWCRYCLKFGILVRDRVVFRHKRQMKTKCWSWICCFRRDLSDDTGLKQLVLIPKLLDILVRNPIRFKTMVLNPSCNTRKPVRLKTHVRPISAVTGARRGVRHPDR